MIKPLENFYLIKYKDGKTSLYKTDMYLSPDNAWIFLENKLGERLLDATQDFINVKQPLHFQLDYNSQIIYSPNGRSFSFFPEYNEYFLNRIKSFTKVDFNRLLKTDAFNVFKITSISSYTHAMDVISEIEGIKKEKINNLPVYDVSFSKCPLTQQSVVEKGLPEYGGLLRTGVSIIVEDGGKHYKLYSADKACIIVNRDMVKSFTEKEQIIVNSYQEYQRIIDSAKGIETSKGILYTIKTYLSYGYPSEKISAILLSSISTLGQMEAILGLMHHYYSQYAKSGAYKNKTSYYFSFEIDINTFPITISGGKTPILFGEFIKILDYDEENSHCIMESEFYIPSDVIKKIFNISGNVFIGKYNPYTKNIDSKGVAHSYYSALVNPKQLAKVKALVAYDNNVSPKEIEYIENESTISDPKSRSAFFIRKISDYPIALKNIQEMCRRYDFNFVDLDVVVGPLSSIFGAGVGGGYLRETGNQNFSKFLSYGIQVKPPLILISTEIYQNFSDHTAVLIHEYKHFMYERMEEDDGTPYNFDDAQKDRDNFVYDYYGSQDEKEAHREQYRYYLLMGYSPEEILKEKVRDINLQNYYESSKVLDIIKEVQQELEKEGKL